MTTRRRPFSSRNTTNNVRAQKASAERRRCPKCNRKSALVKVQRLDWFTPSLLRCQWCGHEKVVGRT